MFRIKQRVLTLMLLLMSAGLAQAATIDEMKTTESFDYSKFTYKWTDADGKTHEAKLTDKATSTEQIKALLAEVYANPAIPGTNYGYSYNDTQTGYINYDTKAASAKKHWLSAYASQTIQNPVEGRTILLVEMSNDWKASMASNVTDDVFMAKCFVSVQLLDKNKYIADTDNPGYLVSIDGLSTNKFYFISKGKARGQNSLPLYACFEQISPVVAGNEKSTTDFSSAIRSGNVYYMHHDCGNVPTVNGGHEFTVSQEGESYSFQNMTLFLPDRRFENNQTGTDPYTYYNTADTYRPKNLMYIVTQNDPVSTQVENSVYYNNYLTWTTSLDNAKLGVEVPQIYYIYATIDGKTELLDTTHNIQNYTHKVEQRTEAYTITYTITSSPMQSNISATSLTKTVTIPGMGTPFFMQGAKYRSRYVMNGELNIYKNTLTVNANSEKDYNSIGTVTDSYSLVRKVADGSSETTIATVKFGGEAGSYSYTVTYTDGSQDLKNLFDDEVPVTSGTMNSQEATITFIDRFSASTASNEQPDGYTYVLRYGTDDRSNDCDVPVYKTTNTVALHGVTAEQIEADTDRKLSAEQYTSITFDAISLASANVQNYTVFCDKQTSDHRSGKAEVSTINAAGTTYGVTGRTATGTISQNEGTVTIAEGATASVTVTDYSSTTPATRGFVPVLTTYYNGNQSEPNTYGCDIKNTDLPTFTLAVSNVKRSTDTWVNGTGTERTAYTATLELTPEMNDVVPHTYYYRVWRVEPDGTETLLNTCDENQWGTTYSHIKGYYPSSKETTTTCDIYLGDLPKSTREVTYIARMYSTTVAKDSQAEGNYYITEQRITVTYDNNTVTGVTQVTAGSPATSVTYYNLTGQSSTTPWQGVNVAVTRHADGTSTTCKVLGTK